MKKDEWLAFRKLGIGGSDSASILGLSPWRTAMDVWMEKHGLLEDNDGRDPAKNFLLNLGQQLEPVIARLYEQQTGHELITTEPVVHPEYPELRGTPDRIVAGQLRGVELKSENTYSDEFGEPGSDQVPAHYLIQAAHYLLITGFMEWDIAILHAGTRFGVYTIRRDNELIDMMCAKLREWWRDHIVADVPPNVDHSEAWKKFLHKKYPRNVLPIDEMQPESAYLIDSLAEIHKAEAAIEQYRMLYENQLKLIIADRDGLSSKYGRVTWKVTKDSEHTDWEKAFYMLCQLTKVSHVQQEYAIGKSTETRKGVRRFLFTPPKDKEYASRIEENPRLIEFSAALREIQRRNRESLAEAPDTGQDDPNRADIVPKNPETSAS